MTPLSDLTGYFDQLLGTTTVPDYPPAMNGLQLASTSGKVSKIIAAVDACLPVIQEAVERDADLLLVHHGMFWSGAQAITGSVFEKIKTAMDSGLAIYSSHIPLDVHPELGNNAQLAAALDFSETAPFFPWKGIELGLRATTEISRDNLVEKIKSATGGAAVHLCPGGPETIREIGIITGGAGSEIYAAAATGIDTFITGEGPHWSYTAAEELGINLIYAGHYATETFGVKALAAHTCKKFKNLTWEFVDHPTGL